MMMYWYSNMSYDILHPWSHKDIMYMRLYLNALEDRRIAAGDKLLVFSLPTRNLFKVRQFSRLPTSVHVIDRAWLCTDIPVSVT